MLRKEKQISTSKATIALLVMVNVLVIKAAFVNNSHWYFLLIITLPSLFVAIYDLRQKKHALLRNYPLIGHVRSFSESIEPESRQYLFKNGLNERPFIKRQGSTVYQRAENEQ